MRAQRCRSRWPRKSTNAPVACRCWSKSLPAWRVSRRSSSQVALRRLSAAEVKAWRRANSGVLWLTGIAIVFLGTIPVLNLIVPVLGVAAMVHVAQTLKPPRAPGRPFNPPTGSR